MMKKYKLTGLLLCVPGVLVAKNIIPSNSSIYYSLNGGSNIVMPPVTSNHHITIGSDVNTDLGYSCDNFNPAISLSNTFKNLDSNVEGIENDIIASATAAVGSLPMYLLQKASPELYSILNNALFDAKDTFNTSMKSCQQSLSQIKQGKDPYSDWFSISDSRGWVDYSTSAKQGNDVDVNSAKTEIAKDPKQYGVPWIHHGKNSGGTQDGQVPINVISDVVLAGYNVLSEQEGLTRELDDTVTPAPSDTSLYTLFNTPMDAVDFSTIVLGDVVISGNESQQTTKAGVGLETLLASCVNDESADMCPSDISSLLASIVAEDRLPTLSEYEKMSASNMVISPEIMQTIENLDHENQAISITKISEDIAMQNLISRSLMLRRLLLAGEKTKAVQSNAPALKTITTVINQLNSEIQNLVFESDVRKKLTSNTASVLMSINANDHDSADKEVDHTQEWDTKSGAVYKKSQG